MIVEEIERHRQVAAIRKVLPGNPEPAVSLALGKLKESLLSWCALSCLALPVERGTFPGT